MMKKRQKAIRAGFVPGSSIRSEVDAESLASTSENGFRIHFVDLRIDSTDSSEVQYITVRVPRVAQIGHIQLAIKEHLELKAMPRIGVKKKNIEWLNENRKIQEVAAKQLVFCYN
jgi:hypothetical protein